MKAKDKKKWVAALRSGKYIQGKQKLYRESTDAYCCMGIACLIFGTTDEEWKEPHKGRLPEDLCDRLGITDEGHLKGKGIPKKFGRYPTLNKLNDRGYTFDQLATIIEKYM